MSFGNAIKNESLRSELLKEYDLLGADKMHNKLYSLDKQTANRLHPNDKKRIIRALEIILTTGKTLKENGDNQSEQPNAIMIALNTEREKLYDRINKRVDEMFCHGLVNEVLSVGRFDYQSMQAIGYKEFADCQFTKHNSEFIVPEEEIMRIKSLIKQHTRNYAKRQITWFKKYKFVEWFDCEQYDQGISYIIDRIRLLYK